MVGAIMLILAPVPHASATPSSSGGNSGLTATVWVSIVGIVVSGVLGPQITAWSTRRSNRRQFDRDQNAKRRDDLRKILDEAAILLASGATNLRLTLENASSGQADSEELVNWRRQVFPMGQRLRLRLSGDNEVVRAYDDAREALIKTVDEADNIEAAISNFETLRSRFLDVALKELGKKIPEKVEPE